MSTLSRALISAPFGFLSGVAIFAAVIGGDKELSWLSFSYVCLTPFMFAFMFARHYEKANWESLAFCGSLILAEIVFLAELYPLSLALGLLSLLAVAGVLAGLLAKIFSIEIPGLKSPT